jgi:hypothetical protein
VPIFCSSTLRDYFGLIFDELFTVFDSRGEFSRLIAGIYNYELETKELKTKVEMKTE